MTFVIPPLCPRKIQNLSPLPILGESGDPRAGSTFARLKTVDELSEFVTEIDQYLTKFTFDKTRISVWRQKYKFSSTMKKTSVNASSETIKNHVDRIVSQYKALKGDQIINLIGPTGSGKSSFNKFVTTFHSDQFNKNSIFACRIEFAKMIKYAKAILQKSNDILISDIIQEYIEHSLIRDLLHSLYSNQNSSDDGSPFVSVKPNQKPETMRFLDFDIIENHVALAKSIERASSLGISKQTSKDANEIAKNIVDILEKYSELSRTGRRSWFRTLRNSKISSKELNFAGLHPIDSLSYLLSYAIIGPKKLVPYVIIDGMDYIDVSDFTDRNSLVHKCLIELRKIVVENENRFKLSGTGEDYSPILQLSMRDNTYQVFWEDRKASFARINPDNVRICAPSMDEIKNSFFEISNIRSRSKIKSGLRNIIDSSVNALIKEVNLTRDHDIVDFDVELDDIFQGNIRHLLNYMRDVIEDTFESGIGRLEKTRRSKRIRDRHRGLDPNILVGAASAYVVETLEHHQYRALALAMSSRSERYRNFVRTHWENGKVILSDNDETSGYIPNIFNYHLGYKQERHFSEFTSKLDFLDLMLQSEWPCSNEQISVEFHSLNEEEISNTLAVMVREGVIAPVYDNGTIGYQATRFGKIMRGSLVFNLTYLENVFFGCAIPASLGRSYCRQEVRNPQNIGRWVAASYANVSVLIGIIRGSYVGGAPPHWLQRTVDSVRLKFDLIQDTGVLSDRLVADVDGKLAAAQEICLC